MSTGWALGLVATLAWLPSLAGVFQFDDYNVIVNEPAVHSWQTFFDHASGVRPLLKATYTLNWTLGLGAVGFHLFNIAVHVVNALLAYQVGRELCVRWKVAHQAALLAALLFALHPVQAEALTYISGRSSSLMAGFYLSAVLVYLRGGYWPLTSLLFALAVATKETALTLPAALLLCELASPGKLNLRRQWPHWAIFVAGIAFVLLNPRYFELATFGFTRRDVADNLLTQVGGVAYLIGRLIGMQAANIDPALPVLSSWNFPLAIQASLIAVLMMIGITQLRRRPWLGFGILWFFLHLAPTNSLIPRLDVANDRQVYLAGWGLFLALAAQLGTVRRGVVAAVALLCGLAAVARQLDYRSEIALWEADSARAPWNARAYNNLGYAYQQAGRAADARRAYEAALLFDPGHLKARVNLLTR